MSANQGGNNDEDPSLVNSSDDENGDDLLIVNVSNSLVYSPPSADPLYAVDLQGRVIDLLLGLRSADSKGAFHLQIE